MLYWIIKPLIRIALRFYFREITTVGAENLEHKTAIYVSNHPSAFLDPLLPAAISKKPFRFLAGAEWFGKGIKEWIFREQFNMLPVIRPWLVKDRKVSNDEMFEECYKGLQQGKRIMIYPEASSQTVEWVREIKTGAARIKLGGEEYMKGQKEVLIVPIGMNYTNPHRFQSRVTIKVGTPIDFSAILDAEFETEPDRVRAMTDQIRQEMSDQLIFDENEELVPAVKNVIRLFSGHIISTLNTEDQTPEREFAVKQKIMKAAKYFHENHREKVAPLEKKIQNYIDEFMALGFRSFNPFDQCRIELVSEAMAVFLGFPLFFLGMLMNFIPYITSDIFFKKMFMPKLSGVHKQGHLNQAFAGSLAFSIGIGFFLVWYVMMMIIGYQFMPHWWLIPVVFIVGNLAGRFTLQYIIWFSHVWKRVRWSFLKKSSKDKVKYLLDERSEIVNTLLDLRSQFDKNQSS